jgi:hypothetical protein
VITNDKQIDAAVQRVPHNPARNFASFSRMRNVAGSNGWRRLVVMNFA